jgi:hypothetical protein
VVHLRSCISDDANVLGEEVVAVLQIVNIVVASLCE